MSDPIAIGDRLYLFMGNRQAGDLVITSHGGYMPRPEFGRQTGNARRVPGLGGWLAVPAGVELHFYGPHGWALNDPGLSDVIGKRVRPKEILREGDKVRNYRLLKFEDDTYYQISSGMDYRQRRFGHQGMDVLTVRNRWWGKAGLTLKSVLSMLDEAGYRYERIHCVFCRVRPFDPRRGYDAERVL